MDSDNRAERSGAAGGGLPSPKASSRRRLLQAGLGAAPAMLTVVSVPVRAAQSTCTSASAGLSIGASGAPQQVCTGLKPDSWKAVKVADWPAGTVITSNNKRVAESFAQIFSPPVAISGIPSPTLSDVLASTSTSRTVVLARYFTAAYLNCKKGYTPQQVVTVAKLQAMWPQAYNGSFTAVAGGKVWSDNEVINWFKQTMPG